MTVLRDLLDVSLDGEWGKGGPGPNTVEMCAIRGTDFDDVRIGLVEKVPVRFLDERHARRKSLQPYDIVFETAGGSKDRPTGRSLLLTPSRLSRFSQPVTCASFARFLRIEPSKADPTYVFWLLQYLYNSRELLRFHTQHTGVARFQFTTFADTYRLNLPSDRTQRRIAGILSAYEGLIEVNARQIAVLEEMVRRLFDEWFVKPIGRLPLPSDRIEDWKLPPGWKFQRLADVAAIVMGQSPPSSTYNAEGRGLPFHQGVTDFDAHFHENRLFVDGAHKPRIAKAGDILFSVRAPVARIALALDEMVLGRGLSAVRPSNQLQTYVLCHLRATFPRPDMIGNGAIYKSVTKDDVHAIPILWPDDGLAKRFEDCSGPIWSEIKTLYLSNRHLQAARDLLLPKLISGEIDLERAGRDANRAIRRVAAA